MRILFGTDNCTPDDVLWHCIMREGQGRIASSVEDLWEEQLPRCMYNGESRTAEMSSISMWLRIADSGNVVHLDLAANRGQRGGHPPGAAANPTFHVQMKSPRIYWGFTWRSSLHFYFYLDLYPFIALKTCLYFLIFGNAIIEGRSSLHDFFRRYIMKFEQTPKIRSIIYMKKVKLRVEHGKSG